MMKIALLALVLFVMPDSGWAQANLQKKISLEVKAQRVDRVLELISNKGDFYFSYNSQLFQRDSLISLKIVYQTVEQVLDQIFQRKIAYLETGKYIILRPLPVKVQIQSETSSDHKFVYVKGWVLDDITGERIGYASVYDRRFLASALTNDAGYFMLKFRNQNQNAHLYISKTSYRDTSLYISLQKDIQLTVPLAPLLAEGRLITIAPSDFLHPDTGVVGFKIDSASLHYLPLVLSRPKVEKNIIANIILSSRQKWQSINLKNFITTRPYQGSLFPGTGTQGKLSAQIINNYSLNIFGGYTGGLNGVEVGGLFNINKKNVQYFQVGGLFNLNGEAMRGMQVGGIHNMVQDSVTGFQVGGIWNMVGDKVVGGQIGGIWNRVGGEMTGGQVGGIFNAVRSSVNGGQLAGIWNKVVGKVTGAQVAGIVNTVGDSVQGLQFAGILNQTKGDMHGVQAAGIINRTSANLKGLQIGLVNIAKKVQGNQIGLVNICDSIDGINVGLINIVTKGYHKMAISANEAEPVNIAFKSGTGRLYSMLLAGANPIEGKRTISLGYGLGKEINFGRWFTINPELSTAYVYQGDWNYFNLLNKLSVNFNLKLHKQLSIYAGPAVSLFYSKQQVPGDKFRVIPVTTYNSRFELASNLKGWIGWNIGVQLF